MKEMLVIEALNQRELLIKKINDKIEHAVFVDIIKSNEPKVYRKRMMPDIFEKEARASLQQIIDLIEYYQKLDAAIIASNARTYIETSYGKMTIASAIGLRNRLRGFSVYENSSFEQILKDKMIACYHSTINMMKEKNNRLLEQAKMLRLKILGNNSDHRNTPLAVVDSFVQENKYELVDPLNINKEIQKLHEKKVALLKELDTKIKVSNATTKIRF